MICVFNKQNARITASISESRWRMEEHEELVGRFFMTPRKSYKQNFLGNSSKEPHVGCIFSSVTCSKYSLRFIIIKVTSQ